MREVFWVMLSLSLSGAGLAAVVALLQRLLEGLGLAIEAVQRVVLLAEDEVGGGEVLLGLARRGGQLIQLLEPEGDLQALELVAVGEVFFCLLRLLAQGLDLELQLRDLIADAQEVLIRLGQAVLRLLLAVAVFGDTGGFFENFAAVGAFQGEDLVDPALADVGVALPAEAGIHKQLVDIPQAGGLLVDVKFALARAVVAAGDHDLPGI